MSGVGPCACADCFDDTMHSDIARPELCDACEAAGCNPNGVHHACQRDDAYGADDVVVATFVRPLPDDGADDAASEAWPKVVSCGCCSVGCTCWNHQDTPNGRPERRCALHAREARP